MYQIRHTDLSVSKKVNAIKALRQMTGIGLKEAKSAIDEAFGMPAVVITFEPRPNGDTPEAKERNMREGLTGFEGAGFEVRQVAGNFEFDPLRDGLTSLAKTAIDSDDLVLAQDLLRLAEDRPRAQRGVRALRPGEVEIEREERKPVTLGELIQQQMNDFDIRSNW